MLHYLQGLPSFFAYLLGALALLVAFMYCYSRLTPHHEWALIRAGNAAAATGGIVKQIFGIVVW